MADTRTFEDRTRSAEIRKWAEEAGFEVSQRGTLPKGIIAAYEAAHDVPDWDQGGQDEPADPLASIEDESEPEDEGPPPPASLDEARERAGTGGRRKPPGWAKPDSAGAGPRTPAPVRVSKAVERDIEGKLALMLAVPVGAWELADPYCGGAAAECMPATIKAAVPLICQSPGAVAFFTRGTTWMLWLGLANALRPVGVAVWRHHLSPEAQREREREARGEVERSQQPPADLSAYTTVVSGHVPEPRPA